jgi:hypothetical protein
VGETLCVCELAVDGVSDIVKAQSLQGLMPAHCEHKKEYKFGERDVDDNYEDGVVGQTYKRKMM